MYIYIYVFYICILYKYVLNFDVLGDPFYTDEPGRSLESHFRKFLRLVNRLPHKALKHLLLSIVVFHLVFI